MADSPDPVDMYRKHVLDHYKHPRNFGVLDPADVDHVEHNPLCGDEIRLTLRLDRDGRIHDIAFDGRGCAISQASASLLTEHVKGRLLEEVQALTREDVVGLLGIPISPVRLKCALLPHQALQSGLGARDDAEA